MESSPRQPVELSRIEAIALDVDGTLTNGGVWWGPNGEEWKQFCFADIMGVSLARHAGYRLALISGEASPLVDRFAEKLKVEDVHKGCRDKAAALRAFAAAHRLELGSICFMGDDVNDLPAMRLAGLGAAPSDAQQEVLAEAGFISTRGGGAGAVRDLINALLGARDLSALSVYTRANHAR